MPSRKTIFRFTSPLSQVKHALIHTVIIVPHDVVARLPAGRIRVKGTFNGAPFALAIQNMKDGSRFFSVGAPLRRAARIQPGDKVEVVFRIVDPDKVDIPKELGAVLEQDAEARTAWENLTSGYQRSLIHYVTSVKNVDSRIQRALALLERAKAGLLPGSKKKTAQ
jgi:hypothetical protein